jgi:hypothetical protein
MPVDRATGLRGFTPQPHSPSLLPQHFTRSAPSMAQDWFWPSEISRTKEQHSQVGETMIYHVNAVGIRYISLAPAVDTH